MSFTDGLFVWFVFVFGFLAGWSARVYLTEAQKGMRRLPTVRGPERRQGGDDWPESNRHGVVPEGF